MAYHLCWSAHATRRPNERERPPLLSKHTRRGAFGRWADYLRKYDAVAKADQSALRPLLLTAFEAALALSLG